MHRSCTLLKAGKSIAEESSKATSDAAKAAVGAAASQHRQYDKSAEAAHYPYELLYHHKHPSLLQHRAPGSRSYFMHHIASAWGAFISLCTSQESRDRFLELTGGDPVESASTGDSEENICNDDGSYRGSIIDTGVLNNSDTGVLKVLTLYQDLNNPLYDGIKERNPLFLREFMQSCGWALGQFHKIKDEVLPKIIQRSDGEDLEKAIVGETQNFKFLDKIVKEPDGEELEKAKVGETQNFKFLDYNFNDAVRDPHSLEHTYMSMTTMEMWGTVQLEGAMRLLTGRFFGDDKVEMPSLLLMQPKEMADLRQYYMKSDKVRLVTSDTTVVNVGLISARVEKIYPPPVTDMEMQKEGEEKDAPMEDYSLIAHQNNANDEDMTQVVTQLEVVYELQQSLINDHGKRHTQTSMVVGKFEACIGGDPNGDELQWRLCSYRPAVEFGYSNSW